LDWCDLRLLEAVSRGFWQRLLLDT
jgi:hypothetical protein